LTKHYNLSYPNIKDLKFGGYRLGTGNEFTKLFKKFIKSTNVVNYEITFTGIPYRKIERLYLEDDKKSK
jgi:hypothetical protein